MSKPMFENLCRRLNTVKPTLEVALVSATFRIKMTILVVFLMVALAVSPLVESKLTTISEDNWRDILAGEWMVEL